MSATAEVENATVEQQPAETPPPPEKQEAEEKRAKEKETKAPKGKKMKRSAMTDVSSSREAEEGEGVVEKKLKPYVNVPSKMKKEMRSRKDEEAVIAELYGIGFGRRRKPRAKQSEKPSDNDDKETWRKYCRQIRESQGFDFVDFPGCSRTSFPPITPYPLIRDCVKRLDDVCRESLSKFNSLNRSDYEFVKVEKANAIACAGHVFFITFQARKSATDSLDTFQTRAYRAISHRQSRIHFCRLKKGPVDSELDQGIKSDVEAQGVAYARGPIDSKLDEGIKSDVEAQDVADARDPMGSKLD